MRTFFGSRPEETLFPKARASARSLRSSFPRWKISASYLLFFALFGMRSDYAGDGPAYADVVEWQSRQLEVLVLERAWRFDSSRPHDF